MPRLKRAGLAFGLFVHCAFASTSVESSASAQALALQLGGEGTAFTRIVKVADLYIASDGPQGFQLTITSGALEKPDGQTPIPIQIVTVDADAVAPNAADFIDPAGTLYLYSTSTPGSAHRALYIRYSSASMQDPGTYNASIDVNVLEN